MNPALLETIIQGVLAAAPGLFSLLTNLRAGTPVSATDVGNVLAAYETARAQLVADIAAEKAAGG
jgi:hypothetical protein